MKRQNMIVIALGTLAIQPQHRALAVQRLDGHDAQFGRLLDQRVHALVGRHAQRDLEVERQLAVDMNPGSYVNLPVLV